MAEELRSADHLLIDEAQFLTKQQVKQIHQNLCAESGLRVSCFGLRTDFMGNPFEGSSALLALADSLQEIITLCRCGANATMNQRVDVHGSPVRSGDVVEIGGRRSVSACLPSLLLLTIDPAPCGWVSTRR